MSSREGGRRGPQTPSGRQAPASGPRPPPGLAPARAARRAHRVLLLHHLVHLLGNADHLVLHGSGGPAPRPAVWDGKYAKLAGGGRVQASARRLSRPCPGASSPTEPAAAAAAAAAEAAALLPRRQSQSNGARAKQASPIDRDQLGYRPDGPQVFAGCRESGRAAPRRFARALCGPAPPSPTAVPWCSGPPSLLVSRPRAVAPAETIPRGPPGGFGGWNLVRTPAFFPPSTAAWKLDSPSPSIDCCKDVAVVRVYSLIVC